MERKVVLAYNGFGLGEVVELEPQKFNRMMKDNTTTNVQFENGSPTFAKPVLGVRAGLKTNLKLKIWDTQLEYQMELYQWLM